MRSSLNHISISAAAVTSCWLTSIRVVDGKPKMSSTQLCTSAPRVLPGSTRSSLAKYSANCEGGAHGALRMSRSERPRLHCALVLVPVPSERDQALLYAMSRPYSTTHSDIL